MDFSHWMAVFTYLFEWQGTTPLAITVSALIAIIALLSARDTTKRKNSIDLLFQTKHDDNFIKGVDLIRNIHFDETLNIATFADKSQRNRNEAKKIRYVLNFFEHLSIGIDNNIYNEKIIRDTIEDMIMFSWTWCKPYVRRRREIGYNSAYTALEILVCRWSSKWWKRCGCWTWIYTQFHKKT